MRVQLVDVPTRMGARLLLVVPLPSWPAQLLPQDQSVPSRLRARLWMPVVATLFPIVTGERADWCGTFAGGSAVAELAGDVLAPGPH